jgi:hypothetical protein
VAVRSVNGGTRFDQPLGSFDTVVLGGEEERRSSASIASVKVGVARQEQVNHFDGIGENGVM